MALTDGNGLVVVACGVVAGRAGMKVQEALVLFLSLFCRIGWLIASLAPAAFLFLRLQNPTASAPGARRPACGRPNCCLTGGKICHTSMRDFPPAGWQVQVDGFVCGGRVSVFSLPTLAGIETLQEDIGDKILLGITTANQVNCSQIVTICPLLVTTCPLRAPKHRLPIHGRSRQLTA